MLASESEKEKEFGIRQLSYLRNEIKAYQSEIDELTTGINLHSTNLYQINLKAFELQWANLGKANLQKANLQWADLQGANLLEANLTGAYYNGETKLPEGFDPDNSGMRKVSAYAKNSLQRLEKIVLREIG